ncbi:MULTISPECIES: DUF4917 family protein [Bacillus amyloliquefaciens group]|uniref:DUF4917 family protein n=2 Tax=Bacillus subtilis group TaxID=653685 RepID=UPI0006AE53C2|nr:MULTISPECIES: DUF4917 family protein [Bacillus amyloliquefaciens group]KOS51424.1 hypothetical protein AN272_08135 [Bacillus amyloliquefaciens]RUO82474.1 DUF4917 family protein [Bacillus velezensis]
MTELYDFKTLAMEYPSILDNLLIGNGFSIEFYNNFRYGGLYDYLLRNQFLNGQELDLFKAFETTNFELVLNSLHTAQKINQTLSIVTNYLDDRYNEIKNLLIKAVQDIHPLYSQLDIPKLAWSLNVFKKSIFTTNYDLLSYWALLKLKDLNRNIRDGFFYRNTSDKTLTFQPDTFEETELKLFHLHGALHFYEDQGEIIKMKAKSEYLLPEIKQKYESGYFPVYVSEGVSEKKLAQIHSNYYLSYCYNSFIEAEGGITILGQGLNPDYDKHLIDAILRSKVNCIAFGVYPTESDTSQFIIETVKRQFGKLDGKQLIFYNSRTFYEYTRRKSWGPLLAPINNEYFPIF